MSVVWNREVTIVRFSEVKNVLDACMLKSNGAFHAVNFTEVVHISEGPLREVTLYRDGSDQTYKD